MVYCHHISNILDYHISDVLSREKRSNKILHDICLYTVKKSNTMCLVEHFENNLTDTFKIDISSKNQWLGVEIPTNNRQISMHNVLGP